jgi:hypothetical protein
MARNNRLRHGIRCGWKKRDFAGAGGMNGKWGELNKTCAPAGMAESKFQISLKYPTQAARRRLTLRFGSCGF